MSKFRRLHLRGLLVGGELSEKYLAYNVTFEICLRIMVYIDYLTKQKINIMGRSVNYLDRATKVTYIHGEVGYQDEETNEFIEHDFWFEIPKTYTNITLFENRFLAIIHPLLKRGEPYISYKEM